MSAKCTVELMQVIEYVTGLLKPVPQVEMRDHIASGCPKCNERLAEMEAMATEHAKEHILAQPLLDTQTLPRLAGVRGIAAPPRRRLYEAESRICIDIQQTDVRPGNTTLEGQVLIRGGSLDEVALAVVSLRRSGVIMHNSNVDAYGDFSFQDVSAGRYDLAVTLKNLEVIIQQLEV